MMRIELRSQTEAEVVLSVAGWVDNPALVRVLREEVEGWLEQGRRVVLELAGLKGLSVGGLELVRSWRERPVELRRLPRLIASLVEVLAGRQGPPERSCRPLEPALQPVGEGRMGMVLSTSARFCPPLRAVSGVDIIHIMSPWGSSDVHVCVRTVRV